MLNTEFKHCIRKIGIYLEKDKIIFIAEDENNAEHHTILFGSDDGLEITINKMDNKVEYDMRGG